jgi:hypothetical protein
MGKSMGRMGLLLLAAASASAETQMTNVRTGGAYVYYSRDDHVVAGKQVQLTVNVSPTWPPGGPPSIQYFAQECTIDSCWDMWPGYQWCYCSPSSIVSFYGNGQLPEGAFDVSPQGVAQLAVDVSQVTGSHSYPTCDRLDLTWTPSGAFHWSEDSKLRAETPTDVYHGVGRDESWQATAVGVTCGIELTHDDLPGSASVQRSHWVNVTRTPKP